MLNFWAMNMSATIKNAHNLQKIKIQTFRLLLSGLISFVWVASGSAQGQKDARMVEKSLHALTETMIRDITSPPVSSRTYMYSLISFYEAARPGDPSFKTFAGQLNGLDASAIPRPESGQTYDWFVAGAAAFHKTAHTLVFSKDLFESMYDSAQIRTRPVSKEVYERSVRFGEAVSAAVIKWAANDGYAYTRTLSRFTPSKDSSKWKQTGPDYMEAVEPHWDQIRSATLTKSHEFSIPEPAVYGSPEFAKEYREVYNTSKSMTADQMATAKFWDCNPYATQTVGHLMYSIKKLSPGGHWIGITSIVIGKSGVGLTKALYTYSLVSMALFDGFIAAWDEKYRTNYLRPITAIQQSFAPTWQPLLQTPPFPEYPSAHSVISMASATVLTALYGDHFHYTDSVERAFGLEPRSFASFKQAAAEAAMSRLYGGIHFREAVENGEAMGSKVGSQIVQKFGL
jgi:hypothetical protein